MKPMQVFQHSAARLAAVALGLLAATAAAQSHSPHPVQRAIDNHFALLMSRAYDKLDRAAEEARANHLMVSDGQPLLSAIYAGTAGCGGGDQVNDELMLVCKERLDEWLKLKPHSITARLSRAAFPVSHAMMARGNGYAHTVSPEGWKLFRQRIEQGRKALESLDPMTRQDPGWYAMMLAVGLAQGWARGRYDAIFFEAVERYPYYTPFYFNRMSFYSAHWYGSDEEAKRVADDAVARTRSRWGESLYARLHWAMMDHDMFSSGRTDWRRMKAGFEKIVKDHPDPWNVNSFGKFACMAEDSRTLFALLQKVGEKPIIQAWDSNIDYYRHCRAVAAKVHCPTTC